MLPPRNGADLGTPKIKWFHGDIEVIVSGVTKQCSRLAESQDLETIVIQTKNHRIKKKALRYKHKYTKKSFQDEQDIFQLTLLKWLTLLYLGSTHMGLSSAT